MNIQEYLTQLVTDDIDYELTVEDQKTIQHEGIRQFIFNKLNSSKYRASATSTDYLEKIKDKIDLCVNHNVPIHITLPFGATKNPYLPTAPGIDWAEVFNVAYLREYLKPIARAYKPGLVLEYVSVAVFEEKVNRIPQKDTDVYDQQFVNLINFYQQYLPANFFLKYSRVSDAISREIVEKQIEMKMSALRRTWNSQSPEAIAYKLMRAKRNALFNPNDPHIDDAVLHSALGHDAFCSECWTLDAAPWDKKNMITLAHNYTKGWSIHVRATYGSSVNFWSGIGVIEKRAIRYVPTVLSVQQYEGIKDTLSSEPIVGFLAPQITHLPDVLVRKLT